LRAMNLGSHGKIPMARLKEFFEEIGFGDVRTLLNSGNVAFSGDGTAAAKLEDVLQREAAERLELKTEFMVRTAEEWPKIIEANPFKREAKEDPSHLLVVFLKEPVSDAKVKM